MGLFGLGGMISAVSNASKVLDGIAEGKLEEKLSKVADTVEAFAGTAEKTLHNVSDKPAALLDAAEKKTETVFAATQQGLHAVERVAEKTAPTTPASSAGEQHNLA